MPPSDQPQLVKAILKWKTRLQVVRGEIECQFNPTQLKISKEVGWSKDEAPNFNAPTIAFTGGKAATYELTLYFDSYYPDSPIDVREYTNKLLALTLRDAGYSMYKIPKALPPTVSFIWGNISLFSAVVSKVDITYTMFSPDGTPIRAMADVSFIQKRSLLGDDMIPWQNPTSRTDPRKTRIVNSHQRLDLIAYEEYGDSNAWRRLAEANGIDNPFDLQDGQLLVIPQD
ncbi:peptidoglycan-binding protein [bacterium]|nr:peptidoglycan-binding protein [bacterium]